LAPGWKRWTYCNGLKVADNNTRNQVITNMKKLDPMILECLAYVKNSTILMLYLRTKLFHFMFNVAYHSEQTERAYALTAHIVLFTFARNTNILEDILNNFKYIVQG